MAKRPSVGIIAGASAGLDQMDLDSIQSMDQLIAVDSGARCCLKHQLSPDFLVGDFDSLTPEELEHFKNQDGLSIEKHARDKDKTDFQLGFEKALSLEPKQIEAFNVLDERIDFVFDQLLSLCKAPCRVFLRGQNCFIGLLNANKANHQMELQLPSGTEVSVYALERPFLLESEGLYWPLVWGLENQNSWSQSNRTQGTRLLFRVGGGAGFFLMPKNIAFSRA